VSIANTALAIHEHYKGRNHMRTKYSAKITADALDALGRADEASRTRTEYLS
jgi:hypothetical protein